MNQKKILITKILMACVFLVVISLISFTLAMMGSGLFYSGIRTLRSLTFYGPVIVYLLVDYCFDKDISKELEIHMLKEELENRS